MKKLVLITFLLIMGYTSQVSAQGFTPPAPGKAVVYFTRISAYGFAVAFDFYLNDKFIGAFKGENYMRYEFDPGEQLIWGAGENIEFLPSNLKEGDIYIVIVDIKTGKKKPIIGLRPIDENETELFNKGKKLVLKKAPVEIKEKDVEKLNTKFATFITESLNLYETKLKEENLRQITTELAIPVEYLK
ncbi:MAG: DUF2846 domain-containing protein [Rhodopseudomonas palustris]|nr:DUF2846 domain-containing protein [Rhodopseudomonas palustris]